MISDTPRVDAVPDWNARCGAQDDEKIITHGDLLALAHDEADELRELASTLERKLNGAQASLEQCRMQLVACGVIAGCNTRTTLTEQLPTPGSYSYSASLRDVAKAVTREMNERERAERAEARYAALLDAKPEVAGLVDALKETQFQVDEDGTNIGVSRQAVEEAADALLSLSAQLAEKEAECKRLMEALKRERAALLNLRDRQCHDGVCTFSIADLEEGIALLDTTIHAGMPAQLDQGG